MANCNPLTGPTRDQIWTKGARREQHNHGYGQVIHAFELKVASTGECLDIANSAGSGNIGAYRCTGELDQFFWFKNRGKVV